MTEIDARDSVAHIPSSAPKSIPRPKHVRIDPAICAHYGTCVMLAPAALAHAAPTDPPVGRDARSGSSPVTVPATGPVLDAMSACPTGAIRWVEVGEPNVGDDPP